MTEFRLNRVFSAPLTRALLRTPLTPNGITLISLLSGLGAGWLFAQGRHLPSLAGAFFYQLAVVLDNCDGEVARAKNMKSRFGGWFDIAADFTTDMALFGGVVLGAGRAGSEGPVALFAALCLSGGVMHFLLVVAEKIRGFGPAVFGAPHPEYGKRQNAVLTFFDALREGDASWFVVLFAVANQMIWLLWFGGIYMQVLWISALAVNFKWIFGRRTA